MEKTYFGRSGRLWYVDQTGSNWLANVTEVSATEDPVGKFEGTLTIDMVNSHFEKVFIDYVNGKLGKPDTEPMSFTLTVNLEDPGLPSNKTPDELTLSNMQFWSLPMGFSVNDLVTRDLDFTAGEEKGSKREYTIRFVNSTSDVDDSVSSS